jgi:ketosteroid isomerase-like protein
MTVREQIESAYRAWNEATDRANAKALVLLYLDDAKLLPPTHMLVDGRQAIEKFWDGLFKAGMTGHTLELITTGGNQ